MDVSIPGSVQIPGGDYSSSSGLCESRRDGWAALDRSETGGGRIWWYRNDSGLLPQPGDEFGNCTGDARGVRGVLVRYLPIREVFLYRIWTRDTAMDGQPQARPLAQMSAVFSVGAEIAAGRASSAAQAGQCAESVFQGDPFVQEVPPKPFCKGGRLRGTLRNILCLGP